MVVVDNKMTDLTNNKIRPFFHIKNFKDGVEDAILSNGKMLEGRSSEYLEGYDFGKSLTLPECLRQFSKLDFVGLDSHKELTTSIMMILLSILYDRAYQCSSC